MDRTMIDRTIIMDNYKAEEKELSDKVHIKIQSLTLVHAPSADFKKVFVKDMFLKPNQKAFFLVMHYLFTCLDPVEFKKRFYWPIIDKRSETNFRSSTVDYLNYLIKKHNLQWTHLKNYIVLVPGGTKFLTFLNNFLDFIAAQLVKQYEKYIIEKMHLKDIDLNNIEFNKLKEQRKCLKANAFPYLESIENNTKKLKEKRDFLRNKFLEISKTTEIPVSVLMDRQFIENFLEFGKDFLKEKLTKKVDELVSSEKNIIAIDEKMKIYEKQKSEINYDRNKLLTAFNNIQIQNPNLDGNIFCGNEINIAMLIKMVEHIAPEIENLLSTLDQNVLDNYKFEENELTKLNSKVDQLNYDLTKYSTAIHDDLRLSQTAAIRTTPNRFKLNNENELRLKYMNTPPIVNFCNSSIIDNGIKKRLALMDDYHINDPYSMNANSMNSGDYFSFANNQTTLMPAKTPKRDSKRNNSTINRSKIMDPSALLRSLTKNKRPCGINTIRNQSNGNLSYLANKWKEQESSFVVASKKSIFENDENRELFEFNRTIDSEMMTTVRKKQLPDSKKKLFLENQYSLIKPIDSPKNIAVQQVQNISLDFSKLSTSPSGRLDSLIKLNKNDVPKILLNDLTLNNSVNIKDLSFQNGSQIDENDILFNSNAKDNLFNVSDSILKDISM